MFKLVCPHCQVELEIPSELRGTTAPCPNCNKELTLNEPATVITKSYSDPSSDVVRSKYAWKKIYPWGYIYIKSCQVIAVLLFMAFIAYAVKMISDNMEIQTRQKKVIAAQAAAVAVQQNQFENSYRSTINSLSKSSKRDIISPGQRHNQNAPTGFNIPADLKNPDITFSNNLTDPNKLKQSFDAISHYEFLINKLETTMLNELLSNLRQLKRKGQPIQSQQRSKPINVSRSNRSSSIVVGMNKNRNFYHKEDEMRKKFNFLTAEITSISSKLVAHPDIFNQASYGELSQEFNSVIHYMTFMQKTLLSYDNQQRFGGQIGTTVQSATSNNNEVKDKKAEFFAMLYGFLSGSLADICDQKNWKMSEQLSDLKKSLQQLAEQIDNNNKSNSQANQSLFYDLAMKFIFCLLAIMVVMVFADFLKAHFDNANNSFKR